MTVDSRPRGGPRVCAKLLQWLETAISHARIPYGLLSQSFCDIISYVMQFSGLKLKLAVHRASCLDRQILFAGLRIFSSPPFLSTACHLKDLEANFFDDFNLCVKICSIYEQMHKNDGIAVFDLNVDSRFQQQRGLLFVEQLKSVETVQISLLLFHPPTKNTQTPANNPLSKLSRTCRRLLALILFTDLPWNLSLSPSQKRYFIKYFFAIKRPLSNRYFWHSCISWQLVI